VILTGLSAPLFFLRLSGTSFSLVDLFLSCAGVLIFLHVLLRPSSFPWLVSAGNPQIFLGGVFVSACLLSGIQGSLSGSVRFQTVDFATSVVQYAFVFLFLPIVASWYITPSRLWFFLRLVALGYFLPMLVALLLMHPIAPEGAREVFFVAGRACGSFGNANAFAGVLNIVMPFYLILAIADRGFWQWLGIAGVGFSLLCLVLTVSFGGVLLLLVLLFVNVPLVLVWRSHPVRKYWRQFAKMVAVIALVVFPSFGVLMSSPWTRGQIEDRLKLVRYVAVEELLRQGSMGSASNRLGMIDEAAEMIADRQGGLWGHGLGQSSAESRYSQEVHFIYLLLWIEGGVLLLLAYVAFLGGMLRNIGSLVVMNPVVGTTIGCSVVALILFGMINPHIYLRFYWIPLLPAFVNWDAYRGGRRDWAGLSE
jgi:hypothetical protein